MGRRLRLIMLVHFHHPHQHRMHLPMSHSTNPRSQLSPQHQRCSMLIHLLHLRDL
jgi:hypothetical protein